MEKKYPKMNTTEHVDAETEDRLDQAWVDAAYDEWKRQPKPTAKELFEIFPEAIEVVETNLREEEKIFAEEVIFLKERVTEDKNYDEFTRWFLRELRKHFMGHDFERSWSRIRRYRRELAIAHDDERQGTDISAEEIATAKEVSLESFFQIKRSSKTRAYVNCPFHDDSTPSFVIFKKENTFHCFGCRAHGDAIDFMMRQDGLSFRETVKCLIGK